MALPPSTVCSSSFQVKALHAPPLKLQTCAFIHPGTRHVSYYPSRKIISAKFRIPEKAKKKINIVKERLWKSLPDSVKDFPWKKAEDQVLQRLISFGQEAFKWFFLAWFVLSFLSDILFTISRNRELVMPLGLFAGCLLSDFMKETSEELFQQPQVKDVNWNLVGIACVFVILKLISQLFGIQGQIFLLHVANGGLMQILWLWKRFQEENVQVN